ncbi:Uncharacterised protein [Streptococcus pneumoniae]|nr:Uncharacterised protein [Streptococcus pneumoniae]
MSVTGIGVTTSSVDSPASSVSFPSFPAVVPSSSGVAGLATSDSVPFGSVATSSVEDGVAGFEGAGVSCSDLPSSPVGCVAGDPVSAAGCSSVTVVSPAAESSSFESDSEGASGAGATRAGSSTDSSALSTTGTDTG